MLPLYGKEALRRGPTVAHHIGTRECAHTYTARIYNRPHDEVYATKHEPGFVPT